MSDAERIREALTDEPQTLAELRVKLKGKVSERTLRYLGTRLGNMISGDAGVIQPAKGQYKRDPYWQKHAQVHVVERTRHD